MTEPQEPVSRIHIYTKVQITLQMQYVHPIAHLDCNFTRKNIVTQNSGLSWNSSQMKHEQLVYHVYNHVGFFI